MRRFYTEVALEAAGDGWRVMLDGRAIRTQMGSAQIVPTRAAAELLAGEWRAQGEEIDPKTFVHRDLTDYAIDVVRADRGAAIDKLLSYAGTDTLCYRADPGDALWARQEEVWEPLVAAFEDAHGVRMERVSGIVHRAQPEASIARLRARLEQEDDFTLAALLTLASLAASLIVALAALEDDADAQALFAAANCEEDWQAQLWGRDAEADRARSAREEAFARAMAFARAVRS
ncbi:ATP12 family protein [Aurantiacibacter spongiae]|uniref:Molecular chaperone n=1 Tax=Aurantiacibacter spongiae TaxID=2488860 RepID=A0A3N5CUH9_9SPHN|nr:ATP12 family chaperone protein [Aurantiacibacter spongiae]RPF71986.1 molecular chaperone [Aurantiacibacter spongiae]